MAFSALVAAFFFSVPSHAIMDRLISRYLADNSPEIYVLLHRPQPDPAYAALARGGILRVTGFGAQGCDSNSPIYDLTAYGLRAAKARGWKIHEVAPGMYQGVEIPLGSFALIHGAISEVLHANQPARVTFNYWFHPNANVQYLLSLAPSLVWGNIGMIGGRGVTLNQGERLLSETVSVFDENGWVLDQNNLGPRYLGHGVFQYVLPAITICN